MKYQAIKVLDSIIRMMLLFIVGIAMCSFVSVSGIESDTPSCSVEGQIFQDCPPCVRFCTPPIPQCPTICSPGCGCPVGQVIDSVNNKCVNPLQCPGPVNCAAVLCLNIVCPPGETVVVPPGECCGVCVSNTTNLCDDYTCPIGSQCKVYQPTGEAFCEPSCDLNNGGCLANEKCSLQKVQCVRAPCPPEIKCTPRLEARCPISGQVYQKCASCFATCLRPFPLCTKRCIPGCRCPAGTVLDVFNKKCVNIKQCPSLKCARVKCPPPNCVDTPAVKAIIPRGQCCPVCGCKVGDEVYLPGETFMIDCNGCTCSNNGLAICTQIDCSEEE